MDGQGPPGVCPSLPAQIAITETETIEAFSVEPRDQTQILTHGYITKSEILLVNYLVAQMCTVDLMDIPKTTICFFKPSKYLAGDLNK